MRCKKHGEGEAVVVKCKFCGVTGRQYTKDIYKGEGIRCKSCGAAISDQDISSEKETDITCDGCGFPFCDDCLVIVHGNYLCENCAKELVSIYEKEKASKEAREIQEADAEEAREIQEAEAERLRRIEQYQAQSTADTAAIRNKVAPKNKGCLGSVLYLVAFGALGFLSLILIFS
jgi:uncharacterized Zn finger protein (UPF0148 family)/DNA-directed RNA polymerase subunit RPC12/RpoP